MKVLIMFTIFVACASASKLSDSLIKHIPSFATGYIIKGEDAVPHSSPYIVSLSTKAESHSHICGGTLISKDWILTAAHCISKPVGMGVVAGLYKRLEIDERTQSRIVDFGLVHGDYNNGVGPFDICILHVSQPFVFNEWVQPAVLPYREEIHTGDINLYGWGQPKALSFSGAKTLQTVKTEIVRWSECRDALPDDAPLHETNVCSDSLQQGISACNGDSGGPLVKEYDGAPSELVGIVSWGYIPCGWGNMPSIYTRVSAYVDWIAKVQSAYYSLH